MSIGDERNERQSVSGQQVGRTPFWLTRRGAMVAVIATHVAATLTILAEFIRPVSAPGGYAVKRVAALDFAASYAVYGFTACVLLVLLGIVLRKLVMRDEDYYRKDQQ